MLGEESEREMSEVKSIRSYGLAVSGVVEGRETRRDCSGGCCEIVSERPSGKEVGKSEASILEKILNSL